MSPDTRKRALETKINIYAKKDVEDIPQVKKYGPCTIHETDRGALSP